MPSSWLFALAGGTLLGAAGSLLLLTHGRIAGISGVLGSLLPPSARDRGLAPRATRGALGAGLLGGLVSPALIGASIRSLPVVIVAGVLVGFGTRMGSGCTSGHGVCGLSRLSVRSLVAVATFMTTGVVTATLAGGAL